MAITDKKTGPWGLDQVYNKINQGSIWTYSGLTKFLTWGANNYGGGGFNGSPTTRYSSPVQLPGTWSAIHGGNGSARGFAGTKTDGTFYMWGRNNYGQLGDNSRTNRSSPIQITGDWSDVQVSHSYTSTHAVKSNGTLWSWGDNTYGKIGQNNTTQYSSPVQVGSDTTWSTVAASNSSVMATKTDGTLWTWGRNQDGNCAQNNTNNGYSSPVQIPGSTWNDIHWAGGYNAGLARKTDGTIWVWGTNSNGVLGQGQGNTHEFFYDRSSPTQVPGTWSAVDGGANSFAGVRTDGTLWVWGYNPHGGLGLNVSTGQGIHSGRSSPVEVFGGGTDWATPAVGMQNNYATKTDGTLWAWGNGSYGMTAQNDEVSRSSPTQIPGDGWSEPAIAAFDVFFKRNV